MVTGCSVTPENASPQAKGKTICDTYLILSMCVEDFHGDDTVDIIYFTDTNEVFMYQEGRRESVTGIRPFHRCAVPLDEGMQATTNRILNRSELSLTEELSITRELIANYIAAKPEIDACNAQFEDATASGGDFSEFEDDWEDS